jgi:hypothetical protein
MGSTETDHSPKETAAEKIAKAIAKSDPHLLEESWLTAKDLKTTTAAAPASAPEATAAAAPKKAQQPVEVASAPAGRMPLQVADAHQDSLRQAIATEDQTIATRIDHNIQASQSGAFAIGDVLKNFDSLAQHVMQINMTGVAADLNTIKSDPSKKADVVNEQYLLQAHGVILANKAMVAYDAAFKPNADSGTPNRTQLINIARQSMADASQTKDLPQQFIERSKLYEGRVVAYKFAPAIGAAPTDSAPQPAPGPAPAEKQPAAAPGPAEKQPNPAAQTDQNAPQGQPDKPLTDQDLAAFAQAAQAADPAKKALEQQIFGDAAVQANSGKYLTAKTDIFYILNGMTGYTQEQRDDFKTKMFGTGGSVQDKQQYIDTFAAKDQTLHDVATELLKTGGDKLPALGQWYDADGANTNACNAFYEKAVAADKAGNLDQANAYWKSAQNYPLESTFFSGALKDPTVLALDAKMTGDSKSLFDWGKQTAQAGDLVSAAKLYNDSVQAADILYKQVSGKAQTQLADAQKNGRTGDSLNADDKAAAAILRGPSLSRLTAAQGLNDIAAQYKAAADKDPKDAAAYKQNATTLNQQAVNMLQEIPKIDPTYGGLTGQDLTLFKQVVSDGIASAQKGQVIDPTASQKAWETNITVAGDADLLHSATIGPHPATSTLVFGYDAMQGAASKIPLLGSFVPAIPETLLTSPGAAQKQITADLREAKKEDPVDARKAIDAHATDLKSTSINGLSTLVSAVVAPRLAKLTIDALPGLAEKYLPEALTKVAPELPGWMKPVAYVAGGLLATVGTNEALQATAQATLHTKMDSQGKILSESAAAYAAVKVASKIPVGDAAKLDPVKFSGVWGNSVKAFAIRGGVGFVPGAGVGLATHGPWSIDPQTNKPYTIGKTAASVGIDGGVTSLVAMLGPTIAQPVTNAARGLWSARRTMVAAGAVNTVFGAGDTNPTQINPATGKHYTVAETGLAGVENFGTGMAGGLAAAKVLPWAGKLAATPVSWLGKGGSWLANKEAGQMTPAAIEAAQKASAEALAKGPGLLNRTGSKAIEIINAPLTNRSKQIAIGSIGVGNAALGTLRVNPTEINPATGERYTVAETAAAAGENLLIGAGSAYGGMKVLNLSGQLLGKVGDIPIVQRAGAAIGRIPAATVDGANSVRRYLGEGVDGAVNYTQKHAITQKLTPAATTVTEKVSKVAPIVPLMAAPVVNRFLAPGSEYLRWKQADKDSDQPESTTPAPTQPAKPAKQ